MNLPFYCRVWVGILAAAVATAGHAAVVFKPGEKARYVAPGEEEMSGNAEQLFHKGQEAEKSGNDAKAIKAYRQLVKKYGRDALAPGVAFHCSELLEKTGKYLQAAEGYQFVVARYPSSPHFDEAIEAQFRIGEMYLNGKKIKFMGLSMANELDHAVEIFAAVIRTAPYGKSTARAQFDIGLAREKQGANDAAIQAYQAVIDKFPNDPVAAAAQYQIGYIWLHAAKSGTKDVAATEKARTAFQDFLFRYPNSEKAAQARANLNLLAGKQTSNAFDTAKFYDKQKYYRAAVIYYNEVIRQQPGSSQSEQAKKRIGQITAKVGEKALRPAFASESPAPTKKKTEEDEESSAGGGRKTSTSSGSSSSSAPLPPADADNSLPPAASLLPDTTTAPSSGLAPGGLAPGATAPSTAEPSASPDASASPAP